MKLAKRCSRRRYFTIIITRGTRRRLNVSTSIYAEQDFDYVLYKFVYNLNANLDGG